MLTALALSMILGALPAERPKVWVLDLETRGTKLSIPGSPAFEAVRVKDPDLLARLKACGRAPCELGLVTALAAQSVLITRVAVTTQSEPDPATWRDLEHQLTVGSAARETSCKDDDVKLALGIVVAEAAAEGAEAALGWVVPPAPSDDECGPDVIPPPGYLTLDALPAAHVSVNGERLGDTPLSHAELPTGCVDLKFDSMDGRMSSSYRVRVEPNKVQRLRFELGRPQPAKERTARIKTAPITREEVMAAISAMTDRARARRLIAMLSESGGYQKVLARIREEAAKP